MVAPHLLQSEFLHDALIRVAEKLNGLVVERLLQELNNSATPSFGGPRQVVVLNRTQASVLLDIHSHPKGPNTPAKIAQRLNLEPSRISHQVKSLKRQGWIVECPGVGKLPALKLTRKASAAARKAYVAKQHVELQLRKGQAKEFGIVKKFFSPELELKIDSLAMPKPRRLRKKVEVVIDKDAPPELDRLAAHVGLP